MTYAMSMGKLCSGRGFYGSAVAINLIPSLIIETCGSIDNCAASTIRTQYIGIDAGYFAYAMKHLINGSNDVDLPPGQSKLMLPDCINMLNISMVSQHFRSYCM